jgi:signal transduction histidine kinase
MNAYLLYSGRHRGALRALAVAAAAAAVATSQPAPGLSGSGPVPLICLLAAVGTQILLVAELLPRATLARCIVGALASALLVGCAPGIGAAVLLVFAGLDCGASLPFAHGALIVAVAVVTETLGTLASSHPLAGTGLGSAAIVGFLAATTMRQYTLRAEQAELRLADAERAREEHARAVALAERANAAREIHDILAHSLGALVLQLDAVDAVLAEDPPETLRARELVGRARKLTSDGLGEARRAVEGLRQDAPPLVESLQQLIDTSGLDALRVTGVPRPIGQEVSVAVRRTAQEGLTNAAKHAPGATPTVELEFAPDALILTVADTGRPDGTAPAPHADSGGGYGIEGLRERATLIGATLTAGPQRNGWRVQLIIPEDPHDSNGART